MKYNRFGDLCPGQIPEAMMERLRVEWFDGLVAIRN